MKRTPIVRKTAMGNPIAPPDQRVRTRAPLPSPIPLDQRRGTLASAAGMAPAVPKREYVRSPELLAAVRKLPCQHCGAPAPSDPAHSNWQGGKGMGVKADDSLIASLCRKHHQDIDQGSKLSRDERQTLWLNAHRKTIRALLAAGDWPSHVPMPDTRNFN